MRKGFGQTFMPVLRQEEIMHLEQEMKFSLDSFLTWVYGSAHLGKVLHFRKSSESSMLIAEK